MEALRHSLSAWLTSQQVAHFGVADLEKYQQQYPEAPFTNLPRWKRGVVLVYPLLAGVLETINDRPTHLYFHHYRQVNYILDRLSLGVGQILENRGFKALAIGASQTLDPEDRLAHLSHRHAALLAGLGWRGKNNLLVTPWYGSRVRLVTVITDAPLDADAPLDGRDCGECSLCVERCPAGAIGDTPEQFDLEACHKKLSEFRRIPRIGQRICGVCQGACRPHDGRHTKQQRSPLDDDRVETRAG